MSVSERFGRFGVSALAGLALAWAGTAGCTSSTEIIEATLLERLYGDWLWLQSEGGIAGTVITSETEGFSRELRILVPNRIELYQDTELVGATTFELLPAVDLVDEFISPRLRYAEPLFGFQEQEVGLIDDRLVLIDPCCDGFIHSWRRVERLERIEVPPVRSGSR